MLEINKEKRIANKIKNILNKRGFIVKTQFSKHTKSVYLKIDNGACSTVRVSDHKNKNTRSKYNVIKNYNGRNSEFLNGRTKKYYNFNMIGRLVTDLESERSDRIIKYGYLKYKTTRDNEFKTEYPIYKAA